MNEIFYLSNCTLSIAEVFEKLLNVGFDLIPGPDLVPILFLNMCRHSLTIPIHYLFSISLNSDVFPSKCKSSFITPLWKAGIKLAVNNYDSISKLSTLPKLLEKLMEP